MNKKHRKDHDSFKESFTQFNKNTLTYWIKNCIITNYDGEKFTVKFENVTLDL